MFGDHETGKQKGKNRDKTLQLRCGLKHINNLRTVNLEPSFSEEKRQLSMNTPEIKKGENSLDSQALNSHSV